jgi:hypothetical protein
LEPDLPLDLTRRADGPLRFWLPFFRENRFSRAGLSPLVFWACAAGNSRKRQKTNSSPALQKAGLKRRVVYLALKVKKWLS